MPRPVIDLLGRRFGLLTVVAVQPERYHRNVVWSCRCACGVLADVPGHMLRAGRRRSCGCLLRTQEGKSESAEYMAWYHARARCGDRTHPQWCNYGGRGIRMCAAWRRSFLVFLADVGLRPSADLTLERKNNARGYFPGNVVWASRTTQARNQRRTLYLDVGGVSRKFSELEDERGLPRGTLRQRIIMAGWTVARALTTPLRGAPAPAARR